MTDTTRSETPLLARPWELAGSLQSAVCCLLTPAPQTMRDPDSGNATRLRVHSPFTLKRARVGMIDVMRNRLPRPGSRAMMPGCWSWLPVTIWVAVVAPRLAGWAVK